MIAEIGLAFILVGWIIQLVFVQKKQIQPWFIIAYVIGVVMLVIDGFANNLVYLAILNSICAVTAAFVLLKVTTKVK